jgi:hypothetical protein
MAVANGSVLFTDEHDRNQCIRFFPPPSHPTFIPVQKIPNNREGYITVANEDILLKRLTCLAEVTALRSKH